MAIFKRKDLNTDALQQARLAREEATRREAEARGLVERLGSKLEGLRASLPGLKAAIEAAEAKRREAIGKAALDLISQDDLDKAKASVDEAKSKLEEAHEMIGAVETARTQANEDLSGTIRATQSANRAFWREVFKAMRGRVLEAIGDDLEPAWAACIASGEAYGLVGFLQRLFGERELSRERQAELMAQLDNEFSR